MDKHNSRDSSKYKNNQVINLLHTVEEYLIFSTYGAGCSTYNHSYGGTRRLNTLAFKIADLIVEELERSKEIREKLNG